MIDFVIPWVDGNDLAWIEKKKRHDKHGERNHANSNMRYRDWGTLKYVLRSVEKNCPWYHKIYLVTEGHYPEWLDIDHEKIVLVTHEEIYYDKSHLPTFSSPSIEMNIPNLKALNEKFIYMNDDTLIIKPLSINRFFIDGQPVDFLSHGWLPRNKIFEKLRGMNSWAHSIRNNINLINEKFTPISLDERYLYHPSYGLKIKISNFLMKNIYKKIIWLEHWHHPAPYLKSTLTEVYQTFGEEMMACSANRFRADNDLNQYLYRYWQLASGNFYPYKYNDGRYCKIENRADIDNCLRDLDKYTFFCPNDSVVNENENEYIEKKLIEKLDELFPDRASFELNTMSAKRKKDKI